MKKFDLLKGLSDSSSYTSSDESSDASNDAKYEKAIRPGEFNMQPVRAFSRKTPRTAAASVHLHCPEPILMAFRQLLAGSPLLGKSFYNPYLDRQETLPDSPEQLSSRHLQLLARNERMNVDGRMKIKLYQQLLSSDQIASLRCLVKASTVSGLVHARYQGGYRRRRVELKPAQAVIVVDQAGLQWQGDFRNTGGLCFYPNDYSDPRLNPNYQQWQQQLFQTLYGLARPDRASSWHMEVSWSGLQGKVDLQLVAAAIAVEFSQALDAVVQQASLELQPDQAVNFKFLRAGMGFFASGLKLLQAPNEDLHALRLARLTGIEQALQQILNLEPGDRQARLGQVKRLVLPYSDDEPFSDEVLERIKHLVEALGLLFGGAAKEDPFRAFEGMVTACTNCADPHAMPGNEGGHESTDASIASNANLNNHNAAYNAQMQLRASPYFVFALDAALQQESNVKKL